MPPSVPLCIVDAFTDRPFAGNPAAVCILDGAALDRWEPGDAWMQALAAEMNLSETAFVRPIRPAGADVGRYGLRWFTPGAEVELCGHATLAAAHLLWETGNAAADRPIVFQTRYRGELVCRRGPDGRIAMAFPADVPRAVPAAPPGLVAALNLGRGHVVRVGRGRYDWLLELDSAGAVRAADPDFAALARACAADDARGVGISARADPAPADTPDAIDIVSRFFAPRLRVNEDPVTGSVHCALAPWWSSRLGQPTLRCYQASTRGGTLRATLDPHDPTRVTLAGHAVTVVRGEVAGL